MTEHPYSRYTGENKEQMILRDYLAVDRTIMANETSFLSYVRTALTFTIAGITLIKFFPEGSTQVLGWAFVGLSVIMFINGFTKYEAMNAVLQKLMGREEFAMQNLESAGYLKKFAVLGQRLVGFFL